MRDGDLEVIAKLQLPLPVLTVAAVGQAVDRALTRIGYGNAVILTAGPHAGSIAATPPPPGFEAPEDDEDGDEDTGP